MCSPRFAGSYLTYCAPLRAITRNGALRFSTIFLLLACCAPWGVMPVGAAEGAPPGSGTVSSEELAEPETSTPPETTASPQPSDEMVVVIDPGHGGGDTGEVGVGSAREKDVVLAVALKTAAILKERFEVFLTRKDDVSLTEEQRAAEAKFRNADAFISLHLGASASASANGIGVYYPTDTATTPAGRTIAGGAGTSVQLQRRQFAERLSATVQASTAAATRGVHAVPCRVFEGLDMPAVLIEAGFVTNPVEEELLVSDAYQASIAEGLAAGIQAFLAARP